MRKPRSLRTRLVVSSVVLIAVVAAVISTVTTIALHSYLFSQLDTQLSDVARRATGPGPPGLDKPPRAADLRFLTMGGQPVGTMGAVVPDGGGGDVQRGGISVQSETAAGEPRVDAQQLTREQTDALERVPLDGEPHSVDVPHAGGYRVTSHPFDGGTLLVGLPTAQVEDTLSTLVVVEVCVSAAGLVAAGIAGATSVRMALRPLRRMARTAKRVSELPLHQGEVVLRERVPERDTDPRTEVGQVGAALNRMLGHVGSALAARYESEMRVRRFVADASHELRTPLASIRGYAELTHRGSEPVGPDTRHALARIESESARMTGLVEDLLLLARLDTGRPLDTRTFDLSPLVVDAVSDAGAAGPGHRWRLDLPQEPALVRGDAPRLQQVLVNLLANARTHTPEGTMVTARVRRAAEGGGVVVRVEDDGPGIPRQTLPRIFERFARGDPSRSRAHGSTGLGLAIVRAVVTAHGGEVSVTSAPGRTVFTVHLPAPECEPPSLEGHSPVRGDDSPSRAPG
ncbi:HAMP domain-containing histidine kinase [Streptomyces albus subsp. chlorinus]|uniref:sensor histidine kinase n=1 Tax=Streptomyces albus TaxID=1888 RepID=UPI0015714F41|nr:HAMP domain-containing sensor histidine kinase [Streptomyces albus]NSC25633.1 HAMP domain-containing histidine kinase [Streptomyces albus subsp. chlorinus]